MLLLPLNLMLPMNLSDLSGVDVVGVVTVLVTQSAQLFHWEGYGLKLLIPPQALPHPINSCTITIKTSFSGQYQFPTDTELVSPVFWLMCEPKCKFKVPLSLHIQHCAPPENSHRLFMARALCTQKELPYLFRKLHGSIFSKHSSYGAVSYTHLTLPTKA